MHQLLGRATTLRTGLVLLGGAVALVVVDGWLLVRNHVEERGGQLEYWETFPLGRATAYGVYAAALLTGLVGVLSLVAEAARREPVPSGTSDLARSSRVFGTAGLFVSSLAFLAAGRFIQFDDTSGFGSDSWIMSLGTMAALLALVSIVAAAPDPRARRLLGAAMAALGALILVGRLGDEGFRFVWGGDEGELTLLQIVLGVTALVLLATSPGPGWHASADLSVESAAAPAVATPLLRAVGTSRARQLVIAFLGVGYLVFAIPLLTRTDEFGPMNPVTLAVLTLGLVCGWAATRAGSPQLAATLWVLAGIFVLWGSPAPTELLWLHAGLAFGLLVLWTLLRRAPSRVGRVLLSLALSAGTLCWVVLGFFGTVLLYFGDAIS